MYIYISTCVSAEADKQKLADVAEQLQQSLQQGTQECQMLQEDQQAATIDKQNLCLKIQQQKSELTQSADTVKELQDAAAGLAEELQAARSA